MNCCEEQLLTKKSINYFLLLICWAVECILDQDAWFKLFNEYNLLYAKITVEVRKKDMSIKGITASMT